jgi:hypothetical protein
MIRAKTIVAVMLLASTQLVWAASAEAGPLLDWIRARRAARQAPTTAAPACGTCTTTCQQTCQRVVVNYVPCTAYRTSWERVPVTTYRQTTSTDPCTGCTVTCNRPCTTYTWRMKQVPFTTYRPVYRTETYQVPVTYTTPAPASPCATCAPVTMQSVPMAQPATDCSSCAMPAATSPVIQAPTGTINGGTTYEPYYPSSPTTGGTISSPPSSLSPADTVPTLANPTQMQKPVIEGSSTPTTWPTQTWDQSTRYDPIQDPNPAARWNQTNSPRLANPFATSTGGPAVQRWDYSPVQLASYESPLKVPVALQTSPEQTEYVGSITVSPGQQPAGQRVNEGWRRD